MIIPPLLTADPAVMAIVNRTKDSFHDRGATFALDAALQRAAQAISDGATWIDLGAVPFSPDASTVSPEEEIDRLRPLVTALAKGNHGPGSERPVISVDTARAEVAEALLAAGARVINDTSGLADPEMAGVIARAEAGAIITHSAAPPGHHLIDPHYDDIVAEVLTFLRERAATAVKAGIDPGMILVDPGPDLNKTTVQTLTLLRQAEQFNALGFHWLAAVSNKDFIGETLDRAAADRLPGSLAAAAWCLDRGAKLIRAHDVPATVDLVRMWASLRGTRAPLRQEHNLSVPVVPGAPTHQLIGTRAWGLRPGDGVRVACGRVRTSRQTDRELEGAIVNKHTQHTLEQIRGGKAPRNLEWRKFVTMWEDIADQVENESGDRLSVTMNGHTIVFRRPHDGVVSVQNVEDARHLLADQPQDRGAGHQFAVTIDEEHARIHNFDLDATGTVDSTEQVRNTDERSRHLRTVQRKSGNEDVQELSQFLDRVADELRQVLGTHHFVILSHGHGKSDTGQEFAERLRSHHAQVAKQLVAVGRIDLSSATDTDIEKATIALFGQG